MSIAVVPAFNLECFLLTNKYRPLLFLQIGRRKDYLLHFENRMIYYKLDCRTTQIALKFAP